MNIHETFDVAIFGGGLSGFATAIAAAESGLHTILVERRPQLGWEGTSAFHLDTDATTSRIGWRAYSAVAVAGGRHDNRIDAPILEMTLDRMATAAGLQVLYYAVPLALQSLDGAAAGVICGWKNGEFVIRAKAFVDATENGLLWRRAGGELSAPADGGGRQTVFFNNAQWQPGRTTLVRGCGGSNVAVKPGVWPGEAAVEYSVATCDIRAARLQLPAVLAAVRDTVPELAAALVTHIGYEPMPVQHWVSPVDCGAQHPNCANLFGAGLWRAGDQGTDTLAARFEIGEQTGNEVVARLGDLPAPPELPAAGHSLSAPPVHEYEVVVCGGGTAGALAGIAAAREGARAVILEPSTLLGGIGTGGGIHIYYHGVTGGIQDELDSRVDALHPLFKGEGGVPGFHPEAKKVALEQMAVEAGADVSYNTTVTGAETESAAGLVPAAAAARPVRRITGVITAGPEGSALYKAQAVIDSTGDADVAVTAGAAFTHGRDTDGLTHAYSQSCGMLDDKGRMMCVNFDAGYCDPTDLADLTRARRHGLSHYFRDTYTPANRLTYVAPLLGLRNSRQIIGDYRLTFADEVEGRDFADVVAYARSHYDNHAYDYENESDETALWVWLVGNWRRPIGCEIPYRCLLPQHVEGMLVACRAISLTHDAHNQLRMQRDMQRLGQVAGVAAAMAVKAGVPPRQIDITRLQQRLFKLGDLGARKRPELPAGPVAEQYLHDENWKPDALPAKPVDELIAQLGEDDARGALWQLAKAGEEAVPALLRAAGDDDPQRRLWASMVLGIAGRAEAVSELAVCVAARRAEPVQADKVAPAWHAAVILLGRIGAPDALPTLTALFDEHDVSLDVLIAAVRALGRIGDPSAADAIEALLQRDDLPVMRPLQVSTNRATSGPVIEDARWQLDLACAEVLAKLGRKRPDLVQRHLTDERAYVRRYADKVMTVC